jgi:hypothetical protein
MTDEPNTQVQTESGSDLTPEMRRRMADEYTQTLAEIAANKAAVIEQLRADREEVARRAKEEVAKINRTLHDLGWRRPRATPQAKAPQAKPKSKARVRTKKKARTATAPTPAELLPAQE